MNNIYEILETCLQELENGADLDAVLFRYPEFADQLRPILETSVEAKNIAAPEPSTDVLRRNRAKVLQHAAVIREAKVKTSRRLWSVPLRRVLVTLSVIGVLFISSTNLVRAASTTLPGDNLYPVKRTWEDMLVIFTFNTQSRDALEVEHENERLTELSELFAKGRSVQVDFSGLVTRQNADIWLVSGIPVAVSAQTELPTTPIVIGSAIHVVGTTQKDGAVLAEKIELLPNGVPLPEVNDDDLFESEHENSGPSNQSGEDNSGKGSESEAPNIVVTQAPQSGSESESSSTEHQDASLSGVVQSINGNILVVNGQIINVSSAEITGTPKVGASVKVEGYYDANGLFIVTKIEFESSSSGESTSGSNDSNTDSGSNDSGGDHSGSDDGSSSGGGGDSIDSSGGGDSGSSGGGD